MGGANAKGLKCECIRPLIEENEMESKGNRKEMKDKCGTQVGNKVV